MEKQLEQHQNTKAGLSRDTQDVSQSSGQNNVDCLIKVQIISDAKIAMAAVRHVICLDVDAMISELNNEQMGIL